MAKASATSIKTLEKQYLMLEKKIIQAKSKKVTGLEKSIGKQKVSIVKLKTQLSTEKSRLKLAKTPSKKQKIQLKQKTIKATIASKQEELSELKIALSDAKNDYKNTLQLQKSKTQAIKEAAKTKHRKKVLGAKIKAKKVDKKTIVPTSYLNIDTDKPVTSTTEPAKENPLLSKTEQIPKDIKPVEKQAPTSLEQAVTVETPQADDSIPTGVPINHKPEL